MCIKYTISISEVYLLSNPTLSVIVLRFRIADLWMRLHIFKWQINLITNTVKWARATSIRNKLNYLQNVKRIKMILSSWEFTIILINKNKKYRRVKTVCLFFAFIKKKNTWLAFSTEGFFTFPHCCWLSCSQNTYYFIYFNSISICNLNWSQYHKK